MDDAFKENIKNRLCPDYDTIKDFIKIKNGYANVTERWSFSIEIRICDDIVSKTTCKPK